MVNLLAGGKGTNSTVKFANFYLIIDGTLNSDINIVTIFKTFMAHLKSKFTTGKGGDSPFKVLADGSYANAYSSIADSFKFIEEAITISGANGKSNVAGDSSIARVETALSGTSKKSNKRGS